MWSSRSPDEAGLQLPAEPHILLRMPRRKLTEADARRIALALPEATEGAHMAHADFRVRKKIFASLPGKPGIVALKTRPETLDMLVRSDPETFKDVWAGRWLGVTLARVSETTLRDLMRDSWELAAPKTVLAAGSDATRAGKPARRRKGAKR